ncbi:tail fiber assembly protein [Morganella morganii]|uniref:tail fiber assembly protein n=1 Tax=Morganella morganii TaxID=582 RepID=UPI00319F58EE
MKMHYYRDGNGVVWGYDDDQVSGGFVREGLVKITEKEADKLIAPPPPTKEQLIEQAEAKKQRLMAEATVEMAPLQDADDIGEATDEELSQLKAWKKYRVTLNRVDTSLAPDIDWPVKP